jgi:hypothetical protein
VSPTSSFRRLRQLQRSLRARRLPPILGSACAGAPPSCCVTPAALVVYVARRFQLLCTPGCPVDCQAKHNACCDHSAGYVDAHAPAYMLVLLLLYPSHKFASGRACVCTSRHITLALLLQSLAENAATYCDADGNSFMNTVARHLATCSRCSYTCCVDRCCMRGSASWSEDFPLALLPPLSHGDLGIVARHALVLQADLLLCDRFGKVMRAQSYTLTARPIGVPLKATSTPVTASFFIRDVTQTLARVRPVHVSSNMSHGERSLSVPYVYVAVPVRT